MFSFAFLIGIYSFALLAIGVSSQLYRNNVILLTLFFLFSCLYVFFQSFKKKNFFLEIKKIFNSRLNIFLLILLISQAFINLIGVLGPEISFDALWYHLTIPKIYLENHSIFHIPGGLLYYSELPKLGELLYIPALLFSDEIAAKLIHFAFGILSLYLIYRISRKFLNPNYSLLALVIFYSCLVIGWISIVAYIDLTRTFFELIAFWAFLEWIDSKKTSWLIEAGLFTGLSISIKITGFFSLFAYCLILLYLLKKEKIKEIFKKISLFVISSFIIPLPYFVLSFLNTGNPFYPLFSGILPLTSNWLESIKEGIMMLIYSSDPISPIFLIAIPLIILTFKKLRKEIKLLFAFCFISYLVLVFIPIGDKARFFVPYLALLSIGIVEVVSKIERIKIRKSFIMAVIFIALFSIVYRGVANYKYIPYLTGEESKGEFLSNNLNFNFGDFYDTDNFFSKHIRKDDKVLLFGLHNLYYVNFPFIDSSWIKTGDKFNYILTQKSELPERFKYWNLIYSNPQTNVNLYSLGGIKWSY